METKTPPETSVSKGRRRLFQNASYINLCQSFVPSKPRMFALKTAGSGELGAASHGLTLRSLTCTSAFGACLQRIEDY